MLSSAISRAVVRSSRRIINASGMLISCGHLFDSKCAPRTKEDDKRFVVTIFAISSSNFPSFEGKSSCFVLLMDFIPVLGSNVESSTLSLIEFSLSFAAVRSFAAPSLADGGENVIVPLVVDSLEWTLSSPPPLHQFDEPPLVVEVEHLDLSPGAEVEAVLEAQGHVVTDIIGKEAWADNDPALYEGLIPQNEEWTEFIDEKTGEWVYMDEFGQRIAKP